MRRIVIIGCLLILGVVIVIIATNKIEPSKNTSQRDFNSEETIGMAKYMTEVLIKQKLKSPSTSKFDEHPQITFIGDSTFNVIGYVDSENSFGAMLRMNFSAKVKFINVVGDREQWRLLELKSDE